MVSIAFENYIDYNKLIKKKGVIAMSRYAQYVEKHRQLILDAEDFLWKNPETGYREWKTHAYLEEAFAKLAERNAQD